MGGAIAKLAAQIRLIELQLADIMRAANQNDEALAAYDALLEKDYTSLDTRAAAFLGRGGDCPDAEHH